MGLPVSTIGLCVCPCSLQLKEFLRNFRLKAIVQSTSNHSPVVQNSTTAVGTKSNTRIWYNTGAVMEELQAITLTPSDCKCNLFINPCSGSVKNNGNFQCWYAENPSMNDLMLVAALRQWNQGQTIKDQVKHTNMVNQVRCTQPIKLNTAEVGWLC